MKMLLYIYTHIYIYDPGSRVNPPPPVPPKGEAPPPLWALWGGLVVCGDWCWSMASTLLDLSLYTPKQQAIPSHLIVVEYSADNGLVRASVIRLPFSDGEEGG